MTPLAPAGELRDLWEGEMRGCVVDGVPVLLTRIDGCLHAYVDRCAHLGNALSAGRLEGKVLTCRAHHWQYDATTGLGVNPQSASLKRLPCAMRDGKVWVDVTGAARTRASGRADGAAAAGTTATAGAAAAAGEQRIVGPVLLRSAVARAIANAICAENANARIESRGGYLRIHAPAPCIVSRDAVVAQLGADFTLPGDLELAMPSYRGRLTMTDESVRWD